MSYLVCGFRKDGNLLQSIRDVINEKGIRYSLLIDNNDYVMQIMNPSNDIINITCNCVKNACKKHNSYFYSYTQTSDLKYYKDNSDKFFDIEELIKYDLVANCYYTDKSLVHFFKYDNELNSLDVKTIGSRYGDCLL